VAHLFEPIQQRSLRLSNRIVVSPMCQYSAQDGLANDWHLVHLGSRAVGGAALVITEAAAVSPEGRISPQDLGIWGEQHIEPLARITRFMAGQGVPAGIQLAHAGRKGSTYRPWEERHGSVPLDAGGWPAFGPSALAFEGYQAPSAMTLAAIANVVQDFVRAAERALLAGFKVVEIHAAHGYLLHQFFSPLSNQRDDQYGGSFENRIRLTLEVVRAVRAVWPQDLPLWVRVSATDWTEGGWTIDDTVALSRHLKEAGADLIDVSSGGNVLATIPVGAGYQTSLCEQVRRQTGMATGAVGMITEPAQADHIIRTGQADVVLLARELLRDPYWPLRAAPAVHQKIHWPEQYERAAGSGMAPRRTQKKPG
jgi:2,4-dienoyl-CoA reductase-like NADH-dependent reductase (Old Yellow Enzyme family)